MAAGYRIIRFHRANFHYIATLQYQQLIGFVLPEGQLYGNLVYLTFSSSLASPSLSVSPQQSHMVLYRFQAIKIIPQPFQDRPSNFTLQRLSFKIWQVHPAAHMFGTTQI